EHGVVDRPTFEWDRDHLARSTLLLKPVRVVSGAEAAALGGRGQFALVAVRPPGRASAWTEVVLAPESSANDGVLVLEVGGEVAGGGGGGGGGGRGWGGRPARTDGGGGGAPPRRTPRPSGRAGDPRREAPADPGDRPARLPGCRRGRVPGGTEPGRCPLRRRH